MMTNIHKVISCRQTFFWSQLWNEKFFFYSTTNETFYSSIKRCNLNISRWIRCWKVQIRKMSRPQFRTEIYENLLFISFMTLFLSVKKAKKQQRLTEELIGYIWLNECTCLNWNAFLALPWCNHKYYFLHPVPTKVSRIIVPCNVFTNMSSSGSALELSEPRMSLERPSQTDILVRKAMRKWWCKS